MNACASDSFSIAVRAQLAEIPPARDAVGAQRLIAERHELSRRRIQRRHHLNFAQQVNDRLRENAGNGSAADMMQRHRQAAQSRLDRRCLGRERAGPGWIVRNYSDAAHAPPLAVPRPAANGADFFAPATCA
jgi:hypothetical protein